MNIYQKLKEAGYNTDGLASPLKIDPPKKRATRSDSTAINDYKTEQYEDGSTSTIYNKTMGTTKIHTPSKTSTSYSKGRSAAEKFPEVAKHFDSYSNRRNYDKRDSELYAPKPKAKPGTRVHTRYPEAERKTAVTNSAISAARTGLSGAAKGATAARKIKKKSNTRAFNPLQKL